MNHSPQLARETGASHHAQRVILERNLGLNRGPKDASQQILQTVTRIDQLDLRKSQSHSVHREVPPEQVLLQARAKNNIRFTAAPVIGISPIGRDFHRVHTQLGGNGAKRSTHVPYGIGQWLNEFLNLIGCCRRCEIKIVNRAAQESISNRTTHKSELKTSRSESLCKALD